MKPDFNIGARNGLLDQKHMDAMGQAIWLYLWFLDKQPKDSELVLGGKPITYEFVAETFTKLSHRSYIRWLAILTKGNYINLTRTPRGCVVAIVKSKKWVVRAKPKMAHRPKSDTPIVAHQSQSDTPDVAHDTPKMAEGYATIVTSNIRETMNDNQLQKKSTVVDLVSGTTEEYRELVSKLYYQVIKSHNLPTMNHNTLKTKIKAMASEDQPDKIIGYLEFMRDHYQTVQFNFKPQISNSLDIYNKRIQIKNAIDAHQSGGNTRKPKVGIA